MREILTDAIRYWELRRIAYNGTLAAIVGIVFALQLPESRGALSAELFQGLFVLAVLANIAYCAAYPVDVVVQYSGFRATWKRYRWVLFLIGLAFAAIIARFFAEGMFGHSASPM